MENMFSGFNNKDFGRGIIRIVCMLLFFGCLSGVLLVLLVQSILRLIHAG